MTLFKQVHSLLQKDGISYILKIYLFTRIGLLLVGYISLELLKGFVPVTNVCSQPKIDMYSNQFVNMWLNWDSGHYFQIAKDGYRIFPPNYGFFPFYPFLVRVLSYISHAATAISGLMISNIALLIACYFLYLLVKMDHDKDTAKKSVKYLLLMPAGFVLSGMLTESLFLCLALAAFYFAKKNQWLLVGLSGFALSLTRSNGILVALPIAVLYIAQNGYSLKKYKEVLWLSLFPAGLVVYMLYCYKITHDYFAFATVQATKIHNPISVIWEGFNGKYFIASIISLAFLSMLIIYRRRLGLAYWLYGIIFTLMPILTGPKYLQSIPRYLVIVFPISIILAIISKEKKYDEFLVPALALLQGVLMLAWVNCWLVYIV